MKKIFDIDSRIKYKTIGDLIDAPVVIRVTEFNDAAVKDFLEGMDRAHNTSQPVIPIIVDSYGGQVYSLLTMISSINNSKIPVATICPSKAMSCGAVLMTCGAEGLRFMDENATIMIHDVAGWQHGKIEEMKASVQQTELLHKKIFTMMAKNCGQSENYFLEAIHNKSHAEWYLNAKEAKKHKLINHIRIPEFKINISVDCELK